MAEISESVASATRAASAARASEHEEGTVEKTDGQGRAEMLRAGLAAISNDIIELKQE